VFAPTVFAQQPSDPVPPAASPGASPSAVPELPKPPAELQKLAFLVGDWIYSEVYHAGPMGPGGKGGGRSKNAWTLGDHHLYVIYASKTPFGEIEGRGFLGFDPERKAYRMDWFNNLGAALRYSGDFNAEGVLVLTAEYTVEGQKARQQFSIKKQEDGKVLFVNELAVGDGEALKPVVESLASPAKK
jgi:hypothetical protein